MKTSRHATLLNCCELIFVRWNRDEEQTKKGNRLNDGFLYL